MFVKVFVVPHLTRQADVIELGLAACGACFRVRADQGCERLRISEGSTSGLLGIMQAEFGNLHSVLGNVTMAA